MAPHAEQLQHIDELPEFASTSLSADFIKSYFLLQERLSVKGSQFFVVVASGHFLIAIWRNRCFKIVAKEIEEYSVVTTM